MAVSIAENQPQTFQERAALTFTAVMAMLQRDLHVMRRQFLAFLAQVLLQPIFFLFTLGTVLPAVGLADTRMGVLLFPGIVALSITVTAIQGVALPLAIELGYLREIEDRLLAPVTPGTVALEKVVFAALRGLIAGIVIFPLSFIVLGGQFNMRLDELWLAFPMMTLTALAAASIGLLIGSFFKPDRISLAFALIFPPLIFTGCVQFPWGVLGTLKWFQVATLLNPLTYASEGLRSALLPASYAQHLPMLGLGWSTLGVVLCCILATFIGMRAFHKCVIG
jgi:ABC-2 type transport system permease protein